jgi:hypothetical protein
MILHDAVMDLCSTIVDHCKKKTCSWANPTIHAPAAYTFSRLCSYVINNRQNQDFVTINLIRFE